MLTIFLSFSTGTNFIWLNIVNDIKHCLELMMFCQTLKQRAYQKKKINKVKEKLKKEIEEWQTDGKLYGIDFEVENFRIGINAIKSLLKDNGYKGKLNKDFVIFGHQNGLFAGISFRKELNWPMIGLGIGDSICLKDLRRQL